MRIVLPAVLAAAAAFSAPASAQHPALLPALVAAEVIGGLALGAAEAGPGLRGGYHHGGGHHGYGGGHHGYASAGGAYVQYYDPRTGAPVGGPVPVGEREYQRRAASVPYDAPRIRVRPEFGGHSGPRVVSERIEPVMRGPRWATRFAHGPRFYGPRYGTSMRYRHLRHGYGMGPSYGHVPRVAYGPRFGYGGRHAGPGFVYGPRPVYRPRFVGGPRHGMGPRYGIGPRVHGRVHVGPVRRAIHRDRAAVRPAAAPARAPRGERSLEQMWNPGGQRRG